METIKPLPLFSIITITFNNRNGLRHTALSVQSQTYADYEWIIIDGQSTDGTQSDFINYPSARITSEPDSGIYDAMTKGIDRATGDYIIFMNAGDVFADKYTVGKIAAECITQPDFIYGDSQEDNQQKRARHHSKINWGMNTHHQAMLYSRRLLTGLRYDLNYKISADYDFTLRFLKIAKNIVYIPVPICIFELGGVSQTNVTLGRNEQFTARQKNKSCSVFGNHIIRIGQMIRYAIRKHLPKLYWHLSRR